MVRTRIRVRTPRRFTLDAILFVDVGDQGVEGQGFARFVLPYDAFHSDDPSDVAADLDRGDGRHLRRQFRISTRHGLRDPFGHRVFAVGVDGFAAGPTLVTYGLLAQKRLSKS